MNAAQKKQARLASLARQTTLDAVVDLIAKEFPEETTVNLFLLLELCDLNSDPAKVYKAWKSLRIAATWGMDTKP